MFANATCAFALSAAVYLLIGKTNALTINVAGVAKEFFLIWLSAVIFESPISSLQIVAFSWVFYYNYSKYKEEVNVPDKDQERANDAILKSSAS